MNLSKRGLLGVTLAGIFVFAASMANAEVYVTGTVDKTKTITVTETLDIQKYVFLTVFEFIYVDAVSEQDIVKNQENYLNFVEDELASSVAEILDNTGAAINGVVLINQSPGHQNNQGNEISITYAISPFFDGVFAHAQVSVGQNNYSNEYANVGGPTLNSDTIGEAGGTDGPFSNGEGIVDINQASGHQNNQNNGQAISLGEYTVYALGEIDLGQFNTDNYINVSDQTRFDTIAGGAFAGFHGIVKVNQSAGSQNNQANVVNIAADTFVTANPFFNTNGGAN
jgi:hypothetical protein